MLKLYRGVLLETFNVATSCLGMNIIIFQETWSILDGSDTEGGATSTG